MKMIIFLKTFIIFVMANSVLFNFSAYSLNDDDYALVKEYLNNLNSLEADFLQVSSDGNIKEGRIYVSIPGKLRISYKKPDNLLITSNGFWLSVQDKKLKQTNNFPLNQTPLYLFLNKKLNFNEDEFNIKFEKINGIITLIFSANEKLNSSIFKLIFSITPLKLRKWVIIDEFNNETSVLLQNLVTGKKYSNILFFPEDFGEVNDN
tara:strand:- start:611 stop:1228 length:618 start_codon:yes stop_codon:yes gene_type:complete